MRKTVLFFSLLLCALIANAQSFDQDVRLYLNSADGVYQPGDTVKVTVRSNRSCNEAAVLEVSSYGNVLSKEEISLPCGEQLLYSQVAAEPVSIMVKLSPAGDSKQFTSVGYLVLADKFMPGFKTPSDLRTFWDGELERMRAVKPEVKVFPAVGVSQADASEFECFKFEINMPDGNPCRGYLAYPRNAALGSLPIYLFVHSAGVTKPWNKDTSEKVISLARKGYLAIDINAHGMLSDQPQEYYEALDAGELSKYSGREFTGNSDYYFHNMYLRDVRGLDYAVTLPVWDGKRILVHGESQGGGQALALAGIDRRITHCVAIVPALTDMGASLDGRKCGWPAWANVKKASTPLGPGVLAYHDGAVLVSLFEGSLYVEAGNVDVTCDPAAVSAAYNNAKAAKSREIHFFPWRPHTTSGMVPAVRKEWEQQVQSQRELFFQNCLRGEE